jgi:acetylornithine/succinyldiaminopimelate/putrescine aminotransferase
MHPPTIIKARNATLWDDAGNSYVDLFSAHGTTWLGHANERIADAVAEQLARVWNTGALPTDSRLRATECLAEFFPSRYSVAGFYSTGMEAFEFSARIARHTTRRNRLIGFSRNMHGKSTVAAYLGWDNGDALELPHCLRLPYPPDLDEQQLLCKLEKELAGTPTAAICIEPLQGSGGGTMLSETWYRELFQLAEQHGSLVIFDEVLTGFYRTGPTFFFEGLGVSPHLVLVGKSLGNGFPISAVMMREPLKVTSTMLPGSTFAGNPLATTAALATMQEIRLIPIEERVVAIEQTITEVLAPVRERGVSLQGRGALWILQFPPTADMESILAATFARGVAIGSAGQQIRLLPPATIEPEPLEWACSVLLDIITSDSFA